MNVLDDSLTAVETNLRTLMVSQSRLPSGLFARVLLAFGTLLMSIVGAAALHWIAWQNAPPLIATAEASSLARTMMSREPDRPPARSEAPFADMYGDEWQTWLIGTDGYRPGSVEFVYTVPKSDTKTIIDNSVTVLKAAGWTVTQGDNRFLRYVAMKGTHRIEAHWTGSPDEITIFMMRNEPGWAIPVAFIGAILGGILGWLIVAFLVRSWVRKSAWVSATAECLTTAGFVFLLPAVGITITGVVMEIFSELYSQSPLWGAFTWTFIRPLSYLGALLILAACVVTVASRSHPTTRNQQVSQQLE